MAKKKTAKTTPEAFIKAVMGASSMADAAKVLGCTRQAISKRRPLARAALRRAW